MTDQAPTPAFEGWVILELMGHRRLAGYLREVEIGGGKMLRIDVPRHEADKAPLFDPNVPDTSVTQFYSLSAVYCITPVTAVVARAVAERNQPVPVTPFEMRLALPWPRCQ